MTGSSPARGRPGQSGPGQEAGEKKWKGRFMMAQTAHSAFRSRSRARRNSRRARAPVLSAELLDERLPPPGGALSRRVLRLLVAALVARRKAAGAIP